MECESAASLVRAAAREQATTIVLTVGTPGGDVLAVVNELYSNCPSVRTVVLTFGERAQHAAVGSARTSERVGAAEIADLAWVSASPRRPQLSAREEEIIRHVGRALSNRQIASRLGITEGTVKRHLSNIYQKLGAVSRLDAVNKSRELGRLTPVSPRS
jgi:DNA-binding NarL/FixJ family response regulator